VHDRENLREFFQLQPSQTPKDLDKNGMEKRVTLIENEYACLWYYPTTHIIHHKFLQPVSGEVFREVLMTGLALLQERGAQKWLSDDRNNSVLSAEDSAWSQEYWLPRALQAGWKYWAMLPPIRTRAHLNTTRLVEFVEEMSGVNVKIFTDPDTARQWLAQQGEERAAEAKP
jgi:hypothetical protein